MAALGSGAYVGFLGSADPADVAAAYPPGTYRRLAAVNAAMTPPTCSGAPTTSSPPGAVYSSV